MKIIIVGDNLTATSIAHTLNNNQHDVTLISNDSVKLKHIEESIDIQTVCGHYIDIETLKEAECDDADLIIAATQEPETDVLVSLLATNLFQTPLTITLLQGSLYEYRHHLLRETDQWCQHIWINPAELIGQHISNLIEYPSCQELIRTDFHLDIMRIQVDENDITHNKNVLEIAKLDTSITVIHALRKGRSLDDHEPLKSGDQLLISCTNDAHATLRCLTTHKTVHNIILAGLNTISQIVIQKIHSRHNLKIIEKNSITAEKYAYTNSNITILEGDMNDHELLVSEEIDKTDAFFSLSHDDEDNLVSALQAKRHGVSQIASLVSRVEIKPIIEENQIHCIDPHHFVVNAIIQYIHQDLVVAKYSLHCNTGEVVFIKIPKNWDKKSLQDLALPSGSSVFMAITPASGQYAKRIACNQLHHNDILAIYLKNPTVLTPLIERFQQKPSLLKKIFFRG